MGLTRYWDTDRACWAYGESLWDGRALPFQRDDERFWLQREALLGQGSMGLGEYISPQDMKQARNVIPSDTPWPKSHKQRVTATVKKTKCHCGRPLLASDIRERRIRCQNCRKSRRCGRYQLREKTEQVA